MASKNAQVKLHRDQVYAKCGGRCALCGDMLGPKWQLWQMVKEPTGLRIVGKDGDLTAPGAYDLPACISCNRTRLNHSRYGNKLLTIEEFRAALYREHEFLANNSMYATYYQKALRFGLIKETGKPIVFYFEREL